MSSDQFFIFFTFIIDDTDLCEDTDHIYLYSKTISHDLTKFEFFYVCLVYFFQKSEQITKKITPK